MSDTLPEREDQNVEVWVSHFDSRHRKGEPCNQCDKRRDQMDQHQVTKSGTCVIPGCPCRGWSAQEGASVRRSMGEIAFGKHLFTPSPSSSVSCLTCGAYPSDSAHTNVNAYEPTARSGGDESKRYLLAERVQFHRLFVAVKAMRTRHRETAKKSNFNDCGCDDCLLLQPILTAIEHHQQRSTSA